MYGNDLSSRSRTLNGGRWRLTRFCSRWSASTSLPVTIVSIVGDAVDELPDALPRVAASRPGSTGARAGAATSPCRRTARRLARRGTGRRPAPPGGASAGSEPSDAIRNRSVLWAACETPTAFAARCGASPSPCGAGARDVAGCGGRRGAPPLVGRRGRGRGEVGAIPAGTMAARPSRRFPAIVLSSVWTARRAPAPDDLPPLRRAVAAAKAQRHRAASSPSTQLSSSTPADRARPAPRSPRTRPRSCARSRTCARQRRQRAEPEPVLAAAVRRAGGDAAAARLRAPARDGLRRAQGSRLPRDRDRRQPRAARRRQPGRCAADPLADARSSPTSARPTARAGARAR